MKYIRITLVFFSILHLYYGKELYGQALEKGIWGTYEYNDTIVSRSGFYVCHSVLTINKEDSSYLYTITFNAHELSSSGKVLLVENGIYLLDTSFKQAEIGIEVYESPIDNVCGLLVESELEKDIGVQSDIFIEIHVPLSPSLIPSFGGVDNIFGISIQPSSRKYEDIFNINTERIFQSYRMTISGVASVDSFQIFKKSCSLYWSPPNDSSYKYSFSKVYQPKHPHVRYYNIYINKLAFLPYKDIGWYITEEEGKIVLERDREEEDNQFIRLIKVK